MKCVLLRNNAGRWWCIISSGGACRPGILGWENKATKVDGTAAWRHADADGMTLTGGGSSPHKCHLDRTGSGRRRLQPACSMLKTVTLALLLLSFCFHCTSIFTFWAVHGWLATVEYILTTSARHTRDWLHGYMARLHYLVLQCNLHRHGDTTG